LVAVLGLQLPRTQTTGPAPAPSGFGVPHLIGASVNYAGHPNIAAGTFEDDFRNFDAQLAATLGVTGRQLAGPHRFQSNLPSTFSGLALAWAYPDYKFGVQNVKLGGPANYQTWADGGYNATLTALANSVPADFTLVIAPEHEPENNGPQPNADGGTWQNTYAPLWSRGVAQFADVLAALALPNVYLASILMGVTFPTNGQPGSLGLNGRDPEAWNAWKYMSAAAKARTILAPDIYTDMLDDAGTANSYEKLATKHARVVNYVQAAGWGVAHHGISEHTINNDINASDGHVAAAWRDDVRPWLRSLAAQDKLAYYLVFNTSSGLASGVNGWVDLDQEKTEFGAMVREFNFGAGGGTGTTGVAFRAAATPTTANNATPTITMSTATGAAVGDYCLLQFSIGNTLLTITDPAGWTVVASPADSGNLKTRLYGKILASGDLTSPTLPTISGVSRWEMQADVWSGVHATTPINGTPGIATDNVANTVHSTGQTTTSVTGCTIVSIAANRGTSLLNTALWTPPAGYTGRSAVYPTGLPGTSSAIADKANQGIGTYGPDTWTSDASVGNWCGMILALRPA
jgi:hypothetical protein